MKEYSTGKLIDDKFVPGEGELFVYDHYTYLYKGKTRHQESPILFKVGHHQQKNMNVTVKDQLAGEYLTNFWYITPEHEFHHDLTVRLPLITSYNKNKTVHVFINSMGKSIQSYRPDSFSLKTVDLLQHYYLKFKLSPEKPKLTFTAMAGVL